MSYKIFTKEKQSDVQFLKEMGMKPHHKVLDVGCAGGRLGYELINYLNKENYYGFDKEQGWIEDFRFAVITNNLVSKVPIIELGDFSTNFSDVKFDYVYAYSVFTHVNPLLVTQFFDNFKNNVTTDTKIFVTLTILEEEGWEIRGGKHCARANEYTGVWYNLDFFNDLIGKSGFKVVTDNVKDYRSTSMEVVGPPRSFKLDGTGTHRMVLLEKK